MLKWLKRISIFILVVAVFAAGRYSNVVFSKAVDVWDGEAMVKLGPASNLLKVSMLSTGEYSYLELQTYLNNVSIIIEALPKNLPDRETLMHFHIRDVRWFDDYAKVEFIDDSRISALDRSGKVYRGQF